jgi:multicomponent Na+:H+ antiporter subunit E
MKLFLWNILLAFAWAALTGSFTLANLGAGFVLSFGILLFAQHAISPSPYFRKLRLGFSLLLYFLRELMIANLRVAYDIITPRYHMAPSIVAVPLDAKTDVEITLLANLITLTPGTLSMDVSDDRKILYVHAMYGQDPQALRDEIKNGFERRLLEVMR